MTIRLISPDAQIFQSEAFRNALTDLDLDGITVLDGSETGPEHTTRCLRRARLRVNGMGSPGRSRWASHCAAASGEPVYAQMGAKAHEQ